VGSRRRPAAGDHLVALAQRVAAVVAAAVPAGEVSGLVGNASDSLFSYLGNLKLRRRTRNQPSRSKVNDTNAANTSTA
jgi:hypothetical protein